MEKQDGHPGLWLAETFFYLSSEPAERNSMTRDRKQDLKALCQVCVLLGRWVNKNGRPGQSVEKVVHCTQVHNGPLIWWMEVYPENITVHRITHNKWLMELYPFRFNQSKSLLHAEIKWWLLTFYVDFRRELYLDEPPPPDSGFLGIGAKKPKVAATQITIIKAEGLEVQDRDGCTYNDYAHVLSFKEWVSFFLGSWEWIGAQDKQFAWTAKQFSGYLFVPCSDSFPIHPEKRHPFIIFTMFPSKILSKILQFGQLVKYFMTVFIGNWIENFRMVQWRKYNTIEKILYCWCPDWSNVITEIQFCQNRKIHRDLGHHLNLWFA